MTGNKKGLAAHYLQRRPALIFYLFVLAALAVLSLTIGKYPLSFKDIADVIIHTVAPSSAQPDAMAQNVIWNIRLPRILLALLVGASLAAAGATYQGIFRNPLVSPDILGVSAGASLGAILGLFLYLPVVTVQILSFCGGLLTVAAVYSLGLAIRNRDPVLVLVLAGIAIGALVGAAISLLKILADPYDQLPAITYWLLGSLTAITRSDVLSVLPAFLLGLVPLMILRWRVNLLTLSDDEAKTLGVNTTILRPLLIASATLMTAAAVSVTGIIGWIGLIIPHIARLLVGPDFRKLLPVSMILGAGYLLIVDLLARSIATIEIPLGILTATVGAPFFIWLLASGKRSWQ
ncbi:iron complex transport system permease protein [Paenochrobactrum gallinarii]|uniref:Iron complex transport system permease protein n=1 Tax=Paenochrobactrum gallinarii TaxID=643673 RepID=A0A841LZX8_9HYPH|nr:iron ABC transporter permease [Paenochrobactrum gallinarii]MBB6262072.1 iron complex transport system permease protein [Paenochrobactrum gallinarii]